MDNAPKTLQEAIVHFSDQDRCHEFMVKLRWPDGKVRCTRCNSEEVAYLPNARVFKCYMKHPKQKFSLKVGTVFEDSPIALEKWLPVMWLVVNAKNGVSSWEIHRAMGVTQKTAWFMLQRARLAMQDDRKGGKLSGEVEIDESFIGGKARNMHRSAKVKKLSGKGGGAVGKIGVQGLLERGGNIRAHVINDSTIGSLVPNVEQDVEKGAHVYTDQLKSYFGLQAGKDANDGERFIAAMKQIVGRRLTYKELTGKEGETAEAF